MNYHYWLIINLCCFAVLVIFQRQDSLLHRPKAQHWRRPGWFLRSLAAIVTPDWLQTGALQHEQLPRELGEFGYFATCHSWPMDQYRLFVEMHFTHLYSSFEQPTLFFAVKWRTISHIFAARWLPRTWSWQKSPWWMRSQLSGHHNMSHMSNY